MKTAVAYFRTSSASNVGEDKDSRKRQADAVNKYAGQHDIQIVAEYYDAAVKGSDPVMDRPGFAEMYEYMMGNGAKIILVETANRFSRDVIVQLAGYASLRKQGISIIPVDCPTHFLEDTPTSKMIRGIIAVISEFEKDALVEKLRKSRERKRKENGRCEGRYPPLPGAVDLAMQLRKKGWPYGRIGVALAESGFYVRIKEKPGEIPPKIVYKASSVKHMVEKEAA